MTSRELGHPPTPHPHPEASSISHKTTSGIDKLQSTPLCVQLPDIRETNMGLYVQYEYKSTSVINEEEISNEPLATPPSLPSPSSSQHREPIVDVLMRKSNLFPEKKNTSTHKDVQQYNSIIVYLVQHKLGVCGGSLTDYVKLVEKLSTRLWEVDPHYSAIKNRGKKFCADAEKFMNFNDPKSHGHKLKRFSVPSVKPKIDCLYEF